MLQLNCNVLTMMQYVGLHCLRNVHNQSTAICRQIVSADILKLNTSATIFLSLPDISMYFSVNTMHEIKYGIGMEVWKIVFHSVLQIFHFPHRNFHSIPFHSIPCLVTNNHFALMRHQELYLVCRPQCKHNE